MEIEEIGIESHYTKSGHYETAAELSRRRNILYDNYLEILEKVFISYRQFFEETNETIRVKEHERSIFVRQYKEFLKKFTEIIKDTSIFQIDCITETRVSRDDIILDSTRTIINESKKIEKPQTSFRKKVEEVNSLKEEIGKQFQNLKVQSDEAMLYYNPKLMMGKVKGISEKVGEVKQLEKELSKQKDLINENAHDFESYIVMFRKRLLQNKYNMLNKMNEQSKNTRGCLTEIMLFLFECVNSKMQAFVEISKNQVVDSVAMTQSKGRNRKNEDIDVVISNLISSIEEYNRAVDQLESILKCFDSGFKRMQTKVTQLMETQKPGFMENLNNLYSIEESPSRQVNETLDLVQYFTNKLCSISDKLYIGCTKLSMLRNNVKKHSDITLSLLKMNQKGKGDDGKYPQIQQLYHQISYDFVVEIIQEMYSAFKGSLTQLKNHFSQKYYKKKKHQVNDSMEISHIEESMFVPKKKPCKKELWLWRDWRDKTNYTFNPSTTWIKKIDGFLASFKEPKESKELHKFQCVSGKKQSRGVLKICENCLQFVSFSNSSHLNLHIPFMDVHSVEIKVKIFQKVIAIETEKGELIFSKFFDIDSAKSCISEQLEKSASSGPKIKKKAMVQLTAEELNYLQANKNQNEKKRQSLDGMKTIKTIFVDNVNVCQVYDYIYSDKPFTLRGKPEDSFFCFVMKKAKNFNYVAGLYDTPGPEFYTGNPDAKFNTCPLYSTRINQFDHPTPPIPFMPKFCHCKETSLLYWLSHEHFDYSIVSISSGAPYADTFEVKIVHRIQKKDNGVEITMYGGLFFVKETSMKGMIESKGEKQMFDGGVFTVTEIERTLKLLAGGGDGKQTNEQKTQEEQEQQEGRPRSQVDRLRNQNKLLIGALAAVIVLNFLLRLILN